MTNNLNQRCRNIVKQLRSEIVKYDEWLKRNGRRSTTGASSVRYHTIRGYRDQLVIDLYDTENSHDAYDQALEAAREDPTGQDVDAFYDSFGEGDEPQQPEY